MTLYIDDLNVTLGITMISLNAECRVFFMIMLIVIILNVVMLSAVAPI